MRENDIMTICKCGADFMILENNCTCPKCGAELELTDLVDQVANSVLMCENKTEADEVAIGYLELLSEIEKPATGCNSNEQK